MPHDDLNRLTFDEVDRLLPDLDELRPLRARMLADAGPAPGRAWSGSGVLDTVGRWRTDATALREAVADLAADEAARNAKVFEHVSDALVRLEHGDERAAALSFLEAAALEEARERADRAAAYADAAAHVLAAGGDPVIRSRALRRRARARRAQAHHPQARSDYEAAWHVARAVDDAQGAAEAAVGAGNVLEDEGRWSEAEEWYGRALDVMKDDGEPRAERMHALFNLHVVRRTRGGLDDCVAPLEQAEQLARQLEDDSARPFLENARGQLCMARGDLEGAGDRYRTALSLASGARVTATIRLNLAEALLAGGRTLDAAEEARRAEREAISGRVIDRLPEVYRLLGRIAAGEGNPDAFVLFERSLELVGRTGVPLVERARTLQAYAEAEEAVGDRDRAVRLRSEAAEAYETLGIHHPRSPWVDRHGPAPEGEAV
jgi:tetratricopeptide (TPR) repeat protein